MRLNEYISTPFRRNSDGQTVPSRNPVIRRNSPATVTSSTESVTAFINERPVRVPTGTRALDAVRQVDAALAARIESGEGYLTDGRGIRVDGDAVLTGGAIVRAVITARRAAEPDADA